MVPAVDAASFQYVLASEQSVPEISKLLESSYESIHVSVATGDKSIPNVPDLCPDRPDPLTARCCALDARGCRGTALPARDTVAGLQGVTGGSTRTVWPAIPVARPAGGRR